MSRGRGIFLFDDPSELVYDCTGVVQAYIASPLTVGGYKFDLRLYVVVTSYSPLTVYVSQQGLVRFATFKYNKAGIDETYAHITNTSINKHNSEAAPAQGYKVRYSSQNAYNSDLLPAVELRPAPVAPCIEGH